MIRRITLGGRIAAAAAAGVECAIARRLTAPAGPRTFDLTVRGVEHDDNSDLIVLDRTDQTSAPGIYNLWFEHGRWAQLSTEIVDRGPTHVAQRITGTAPGFTPKTGDRASWSGIYYATPVDAGSTPATYHHDPAKLCPVWRINGDRATWAIHLHGSTRAGTLRGVLAASRTRLHVPRRQLSQNHRRACRLPRVGAGRTTHWHAQSACRAGSGRRRGRGSPRSRIS